MNRSLLPALAVALVLVGCSKSTQPHVVQDAAPVADSPVHALDRLRWSWAHRDTLTYGSLPAGNFWYGYLVSDSATNPWGNTAWSRDEELGFVRHLFAGGAASGSLPASDILIAYQSTPVPTGDSRPGRDPGWHQEASLIVAALIRRTDGTEIQIGAPVRFFLVRGDSAVLTPAMIGAGLTARPDRWYVEGWNDLNTTPVSSPKHNSFALVRDEYR